MWFKVDFLGITWLTMDCCVLGIIFLAFIIYLFIKLVYADGNFMLLLSERFGQGTSDLEGNVIWITGASSGIGEYLAYEFAKVKCQMVISARNKEALENVKRKCMATGKLNDEDIFVLQMDVLNLSSHEECVNKILDRFGKIDILINNAGRSQAALIKDTSLEVDREMIKLNVLAPISIVKKVLPHMLERNHGHVVVTSSVLGKTGMAYSASYCLSKFAIEGWHQSLRAEMVNDDIDVTVVCPGPVHSECIANSFIGVPGERVGDRAVDFKRMTSERCAKLMSVAIANKLSEVWIAEQPVLLMCYVVWMWPTFMPWFMKNFSSAFPKLGD